MTTQTMNRETVAVKQLDYRPGSVIENERTAVGQKVTRQPDGPGKRIGVKGEITGIANVVPGGAKLFRERLPQIQAEAAYWEGRVGTLHDFRAMLIDNDTRIMFTIVYDGEFRPYIDDVLKYAGPWLDAIFLGVFEGFKGSQDPEALYKLLASRVFEADVFFAGNPNSTVRDITKMEKVSKAVSELLDAAQ